MYRQKCLFLIIIAGFVSNSVLIVALSQNDTAETLGNLVGFALQSRQNFGYDPYQEQNAIPPPYNPYYQKRYPPTKYPVSPYAPPFPYKEPTFVPRPTHFQKPYPARPIYSNDLNHQPPPTWEHTKEAIMEVLYSLSTNDDLQCVPKILCEVTSGAIVGRQSGTNLPVNIDMESLLGILSSFSGVQASPLLNFGKAALLGYTSKNNPRSCDRAYPDCPRDPNKLVQYLNNHNGGFFRYFKGIHPPHMQIQNYPPQYQQGNLHQNYQAINEITPQHNQGYAPYYQGQDYQDYRPGFYRQKAVAEKRIQNKPISYIPGNTFGDQNRISFLNEDFEGFRSPKELAFPPNKDHFSLAKTRSPLKFPEDNYEDYPDQPFRKPKELPYDISFYQSNDLDLQKPLPNHKATPMIFPVRTGTGDLRLDFPEEDGSSVAFEDDDVRVKLKGFRNEFSFANDDNANDDLRIFNNYRGGKAFSFFPSR